MHHAISCLTVLNMKKLMNKEKSYAKNKEIGNNKPCKHSQPISKTQSELRSTNLTYSKETKGNLIIFSQAFFSLFWKCAS
jgi:hypothetical protein